MVTKDRGISFPNMALDEGGRWPKSGITCPVERVMEMVLLSAAAKEREWEWRCRCWWRWWRFGFAAPSEAARRAARKVAVCMLDGAVKGIWGGAGVPDWVCVDVEVSVLWVAWS